jgi:hypothetical protein
MGARNLAAHVGQGNDMVARGMGESLGVNFKNRAGSVSANSISNIRRDSTCSGDSDHADCADRAGYAGGVMAVTHRSVDHFRPAG